MNFNISGEYDVQIVDIIFTNINNTHIYYTIGGWTSYQFNIIVHARN